MRLRKVDRRREEAVPQNSGCQVMHSKELVGVKNHIRLLRTGLQRRTCREGTQASK